MKNSIAILLFSLAFLTFSCGGGTATDTTTEDTASNETPTEETTENRTCGGNSSSSPYEGRQLHHFGDRQ
jgi:hypothetical protein